MDNGRNTVQASPIAPSPRRSELDATIDAIGDVLREVNDPVYAGALLDAVKRRRDQRRKERFRLRLFPPGRPRRPGGAA